MIKPSVSLVFYYHRVLAILNNANDKIHLPGLQLMVLPASPPSCPYRDTILESAGEPLQILTPYKQSRDVNGIFSIVIENKKTKCLGT